MSRDDRNPGVAWFVRAGRKGMWRERFITRSAVYIGYGIATLPPEPTDDDLRGFLKEADPDSDLAQRLTQTKWFLRDIHVGDLILSDLYEDRIAYGDVASHWKINELESRGRIYRDVRWLGTVRKNEFPPSTIRHIHAPGTVKRLTDDEMSGVIALERVADAIAYREGRSKSVLVTAKERDPAARAACLAHYGPRCFVCGFESRVCFPSIDRDLIHIHHLNPLADADGDRPVDPIADLCPLCPNCHAAAHAHHPPYSISELKAMRDIKGKNN